MLDRNVVVGQRIRALRMQKGLGQSQAAKMSDFFVDIDKDIKTASASSVGASGEPVVTLRDMIEALNMLKEKHS